MTRADLSKMADAVLEEIAGATCYEGREEGAISDVRRLVREARELLALERVIALEHFRLEGYREQGFSDCDVCGKLATFEGWFFLAGDAGDLPPLVCVEVSDREALETVVS